MDEGPGQRLIFELADAVRRRNRALLAGEAAAPLLVCWYVQAFLDVIADVQLGVYATGLLTVGSVLLVWALLQRRRAWRALAASVQGIRAAWDAGQWQGPPPQALPDRALRKKAGTVWIVLFTVIAALSVVTLAADPSLRALNALLVAALAAVAAHWLLRGRLAARYGSELMIVPAKVPMQAPPCSFCSARAELMIPVIGSDGEPGFFTACRLCGSLVECGDRDGLARRAVANAPERPSDVEATVATVRLLHEREFWSAQRGALPI